MPHEPIPVDWDQINEAMQRPDFQQRWALPVHDAEIPMPLPQFRGFTKSAMVTAITNNNPEVWEKLLYAVDEIYETDCLIAGGAVRDHLLGIPAKDIDIFVNYNHGDARDKAAELGWGEAYEVQGRGYGRKGKEENFGAFRVLEFVPSIVGGSVQLIFKPGETGEAYENDVVSRFDLDITKSSYYNGRIQDTDMAKTDRDNKTITFCGEGDAAKSYGRCQRFVERAKSYGMDFKPVGFKKMEDIVAEKIKKAAEQVAIYEKFLGKKGW